MNKKLKSKKYGKKPKNVLRLPDLEHAKSAVMSSLSNVDAQRGYRHAIDEFVDWYCSEPRLALNRIVVLRYRQSPRGETSSARDNQSPSGCCAQAGIRSSRLRTPQC